jgi:heptaprenyl diphosphate synthase
VAISQEVVDDLARRGAERGVDLRPGLDLVEDRLRATARHQMPFMEEGARHLIDAGGKRFRPLLALLSGLLGGSDVDDPRLVDAGTIVELVHLSTLYHDDVIDEADRRRGVTAAHVTWSNTVSILTGDFLLARASELSAGLGVEVTRIMARTIADLCAGQIREVQGSAGARAHNLPPVEDGREHYLATIGEKTASLISASCRVGGVVSGQHASAKDALSDYGWHLGMSFQLADDVLDLVGDATDSGKVPGTDLREGVRTLPVLLALEAEGPDSELARLVERTDDEAVTSMLRVLEGHSAIALARDAARMEAAKAKRALGLFADDGDQPVVQGLVYLADYAVDRVR